MRKFPYRPLRLSRRQRSLWLLVLLLGMIGTQMLAQAHRLLHSGVRPEVVVQAPESIGVSAAGFWGHVRQGQIGDADCQLCDQIAAGDAALLGAVQFVPSLPIASLLLPAQDLVRSRVCRSFAARAPPLTR